MRPRPFAAAVGAKLGGKGALVVLDDADVQRRRTVDQALVGILSCARRRLLVSTPSPLRPTALVEVLSCSATSRLLIQRPIYAIVVERAREDGRRRRRRRSTRRRRWARGARRELGF